MNPRAQMIGKKNVSNFAASNDRRPPTEVGWIDAVSKTVSDSIEVGSGADDHNSSSNLDGASVEGSTVSRWRWIDSEARLAITGIVHRGTTTESAGIRNRLQK